MRRRTGLVAALLVAAGATAAAQSGAAWPQLHGPSRNGLAGTAIPRTASLAVAWKKPMPSGGAGLVIAGNQVYTLGSENEQDVLFAFDAATGVETWRRDLGPTHADATANGPNSTPVIAGDLIVTISSRCLVQAIDLRTHQVAWTQDLAALFDSAYAKRGGCGMAPLLAGSRIVLVTGASKGPRLAAFDAATGKPAWTTADLPGGYSQVPGWMAMSGGLVLYHHVRPPNRSGITAIDARTGVVAWQFDGTQGESDATPVAAGNGRVLLESWNRTAVYDVPSGSEVWATTATAAMRNPAIVHNGHIYMFGGQSVEYLTCLDATNGEVKWTSRIYRSHLLLAGDTLVVMSESAGLLRLVAADPSGYRELARIPVLAPGARTGTPPSIGAGHIFLRNLDEIVAVKIGG